MALLRQLKKMFVKNFLTLFIGQWNSVMVVLFLLMMPKTQINAFMVFQRIIIPKQQNLVCGKSLTQLTSQVMDITVMTM